MASFHHSEADVPDKFALLGASITASPNVIRLQFSRAVAGAAAQTTANYQVSNGVTASSVTVTGDGSAVDLTLIGLQSDRAYQVTVGEIPAADQNYGKLTRDRAVAGFYVGEIGGLVGFQPVVLAARLGVSKRVISCQPTPGCRSWLLSTVASLLANTPERRILARLTLKGNYIWDAKEPDRYLDGEAFGRKRAGDRTSLRLESGSGDGRCGGDFEMWFWLTPEPTGPPQPSGECITFSLRPGFNLFTNPFALDAPVVRKGDGGDRAGSLFDVMAADGMQVYVYGDTGWTNHGYDGEWLPSRPLATPGTVVLVRLLAAQEATLCGKPADYSLEAGAVTRLEEVPGLMWVVIRGGIKSTCREIFGREAPAGVRLYRARDSLAASGSLTEGLGRWGEAEAWNRTLPEGEAVVVFVPARGESGGFGGVLGDVGGHLAPGIIPLPQPHVVTPRGTRIPAGQSVPGAAPTPAVSGGQPVPKARPQRAPSRKR